MVYPPCSSGLCTDRQCCTNGHDYKVQWPELLGMNGEAAERIVKSDNPLVTVILMLPGRVGTADFCCNRVWIFIDQNGNVTTPFPMVG
ncbi:hypothetical protein Dimus_021595 [Dionaea muscipula]